ncbi:MAG: 2-isopropylmalate synthase [Candidatus Jacksonbacteria bacterium RIFOXYC2_FULL_44_29]|nr:MAG: 2-isopropylmalate synthase LeuA [Parcubacteria group bacterium GW2011_GWC2_44_22]OGY76269.1 MAG: 2-isopropylmalate synthase [Candidatus Jacksonbacteria bacterium RIFOXYA2_FULL_43_12]OGY77111.1 MAG: 2-isopropylmalate synthase [Candidatus Jacksonbacteria bacterium RIFOXYB2_FULL_44_15]OGY79471.1 MAG: 2-isopropylmalate synthase [Candidatus Jacksonbacteria bacterium RIFOXYD2_FULL_43_21]OGY80994.1 MAG: 2-isopropylmalate synthase [Candidatus Jacksonbacteria bacterium RIFOXYC2_FULL_44_29]HBH46
MRTIKIFDTTLRDGEQSPGASLTTPKKIQIALQLEKLGVDVIEAGFPIASPDDFNAVSLIGQKIKKAAVCGLCRALDQDIDRAFDALKGAVKPRIHTFVGTSPLHLQYILHKTRQEVIQMATAAVKRARGYVKDVEFSAMDASRTDVKYLCEVIRAAIAAGATTINVPDTVGYAVPSEWGKFIKKIIALVPAFNKNIILSVHCHNDLGLSTANSLVAVEAGARQVECAINGLGERGGNASLEEVVMSLRTRKSYFDADTRINTREIYPASRMVSELSGIAVQRNKAIVGANAFAHESGIHQDGVLKKRETFEIMRAQDVGWPCNQIVLGKHSGRHALKTRLSHLGIKVEGKKLQKFYERFIKIADRKKEVTDADLKRIKY